MNNLTWESVGMLRIEFTQVAFWNGTPSVASPCIPEGRGEVRGMGSGLKDVYQNKESEAGIKN